MQVGNTVRYFNETTQELEEDFGVIIGVRMVNPTDTEDILCTVRWANLISEAWEWELRVVENIDDPSRTFDRRIGDVLSPALDNQSTTS
tara:strand:+ start:1422 stop:1688 length:267 start_codon:yes stop_codon:yes gene_type:complete